jgi:hypothetical protein
LLLSLTAVAPAHGQAAGNPEFKRDCAASYESAQLLRESGHLLEALDALVICSQQTCHPAVRSDCVQWFQEVKQAVPSVVVSARSAEQDLLDVRVFVDGRLVAKRLDGRPLDLNPGSHSFRFETPGFSAEERQMLLVPGEKLRPIVVTFGRRAGEAAPPPPQRVESAAPPAGENIAVPPASGGAEEPTPRPEPSMDPSRPIPVLSYVFGAVALAGVAGFAGFGLSGLEEYNSLESSCRPACDSSKVDAVRTKLVLADISLGVAIGSAVAATILYLGRPTTPSHEQPTQSVLRPVLEMDPVNESATLAIGGRF